MNFANSELDQKFRRIETALREDSRQISIGILQDIKLSTQDLLTGLEDAYLAMLKVPDGAWRIRNQSALVAALLAICAATGQDPQTVQEAFEARALEEKLTRA